ncbi:hypothetical protein RS3R6_39080 [Pseudomonas atacamensis]|uniref:Uncharacterized protein n=1 Tax=Pseudomonas atacamensis TaxID=2565368 RepID=A0ABQ5PP33_9PSED|nr:hypothetical protein RS3R1_43270 [Pseudomonas atacamensis]GLH55726.1 hypothetical protein RS3R6_39080 [Pseudomonas atacamensis]
MTAGKRGNIRKILRMIIKGIRARLYTAAWGFGRHADRPCRALKDRSLVALVSSYICNAFPVGADECNEAAIF